MTDDISKVVPPEAVPVKDDALNFGVVQAKDWVIPTACGVRVVDERMAYGWNECRNATIARLESATTPAEVGDEILAWRFDYCGTHAMVWLNRPADAAMFANVTPLVDARYAATLARQLAEAKAEIAAHERNDLAATDLIHSLQQRLEQAASQLAEATRRLADLQAVADEYNAFIHHHSSGGDFDSFMRERYPDLALTKEPTK